MRTFDMRHDPDAGAVRDAVLGLVQRGWSEPPDEGEFGDVALRVFRFQFEHSAPYRAFCERRGRTPTSVSHWTSIPAVPTAAFREVPLVAGDAARAEAVFRTSGTTSGAERRGAHYVLDLSVYDASLLQGFRACVLPDGISTHMISLVPAAAQAPDSSLSYMITVVMRELGATSAGFADVERGIDYAALERELRRAEQRGAPVCLLGTSFAFVHWLDHLERSGGRFELPAGSRLMDTGGFKGRSREVAEPELRELYAQRIGIAEPFVVNEYGMTEMCSQFYDAALRDRVLGAAAVPRKIGPPWVRSRVMHPESLEPVAEGDVGILQHLDLANVFSVACIQTEDLAVRAGDGFRLLGRAAGAVPRGCSVAMDLLLESIGRGRS